MTVLNPEVHPLTLRDPGPDLGAVRAYAFPPALVARLQAEQGWTSAFTLRALEEYRRFLVLAATAPHPVTPSRVVDEVWHLHLTFTRDYWERLTPLLPAPLHHEPGVGEAGEGERFADQYGRTLDLYARTFAQTPPLLYWPDPRGCPAREAQLQQRQLTLSPPPRRAPARWWSLGLALGLTWLGAVVLGLAWPALLGLFLGSSLLFGLLLTWLAQLRPRREAAAGSADRGGGFSSAGDSSDSSCAPASSGADSCSDGGSGCGGGCSS